MRLIGIADKLNDGRCWRWCTHENLS